MTRKLFEDKPSSLFSPLIDVVLNGLASILILLMIYMILVRPSQPSEPESLKFIEGVEPTPAIRGLNYIFAFPVTGGIGRRVFSLTGKLPEGLNFDNNSGTIYGFPNVDFGSSTTSEFKINVEVSDSLYKDNRLAVLTLHPVAVPYYEPLAISSKEERLQSGRVDITYNDAIGAAGGVEPYIWRIVSGSLPPGLQLLNGIIIGTPKQAGAFPFTAEVSHSQGKFSYWGRHVSWSGERKSKVFQIQVFERLKPELNLPIGRIGEEYFGGVFTNSLVSDEQVHISSSIPGLHPSEDGRILQGIPSDSGTYTIAYEIKNKSNLIEKGERRIRILPRRPTPQAGSATFQAWINEKFDYDIPYSGMNEPVTMTAIDSLPKGLLISEGRLRGTPLEFGMRTFRIKIQDAIGNSNTGELSIRISPRKKSRLEISAPDHIYVVVSKPFYFVPLVSGGEGIYKWVMNRPLPEGLEFNTTGVLQGQLNNTGEWNINLRVIDLAARDSASTSLVLNAIPAEYTSPKVLTTKVPNAIIGKPYHIEFASAGGVGTPKWITNGSLPPELKFNNSGISGIPTSSDSTQFEIKVIDEINQQDGPYKLSILAVDPTQEIKLKLNEAIEQVKSKDIKIEELNGILNEKESQLALSKKQLEQTDIKVKELETKIKEFSDREGAIFRNILFWIFIIAFFIFVIVVLLFYLKNNKATQKNSGNKIA